MDRTQTPYHSTEVKQPLTSTVIDSELFSLTLECVFFSYTDPLTYIYVESGVESVLKSSRSHIRKTILLGRNSLVEFLY